MDAPDSLEPLWLLLSDCQLAIEEEIQAVRTDLARRNLDGPIAALSGRARGDAGSGTRYGFQIAGGMYDIRIDDRVRVRTAGRETLGVVVSFERGIGLLGVVVPEWLGDRVDGAELEFDPTWLLRELSQRLLELADEPDRHFPRTVLTTLGRRPPRIGVAAPRLPTSDDLNEPQRAALGRILGSEAQLVWGPPGTGKSRLVARAALELAERGRVLVTATTNGAVDEIADRLRRIADPVDIAAGRIVRVGSDLERAADDPLRLESVLARRIEGGAGGVLRSIEDLERQLGPRSSSPPENGRTSAIGPHARLGRLLGIARARDDAEAARAVGRALHALSRQAEETVEAASVVLTTFARLSVRDELRDVVFDALIVDEASTAPLPYVAFAASRTSRATVAVGDFQQLPPVVVSDGPAAERWLKRDLFRETGVVSSERSGSGLPAPHDGLCAMLDVQYRMAPEIRAIVSDSFYGGRLRDAEEVSERPPSLRAVRLFDTSGLEPIVERLDGSRRNPAHADVIMSFLGRLAREGFGDIAVVSPYRAQTRHLRDLVRRRLGRAAPEDLQVSTIHRFQGREKRIVVIDTVDAPPGRSWFLDETKNTDFPRLLNVALSRARDALVIVASLDGLRRTLPGDALLRRLLERIAAESGRTDARAMTAPQLTLDS
ncbi:MAG: AAA domain-containing protein [Gemmatimonadetes bacterium]|nr:AAA domain-containing protein [Gemmatimonadota bacterium]